MVRESFSLAIFWGMPKVPRSMSRAQAGVGDFDFLKAVFISTECGGAVAFADEGVVGKEAADHDDGSEGEETQGGAGGGQAEADFHRDASGNRAMRVPHSGHLSPGWWARRS